MTTAPVDQHTDDPKLVVCPMCGSRFDPAQTSRCDTCPMHKGCALVCCPECGYNTVDPRRSQIVGVGSKLAGLLRLPGRRRGRRANGPLTLADVEAGSKVRVEELDGLPVESRHQLQAYGLTPGRSVEVVQQLPVTVVRVEQLDLAFEAAIASSIHVRREAPAQRGGIYDESAEQVGNTARPPV
jgi:Fe2+ transport system protein FeoA